MRKSFYRWAVLALTATACGAPELSGGDAKSDAPRYQELGGYDATAPVSRALTDPEADENGEHHGDVTTVILAKDETGGSGVEAIYWSMTGATTKSGVATGSQAWLPVINQQGTTTITFYAKDKAGNYEAPKTLNVIITPEQSENCSPVTLNDFNLFVLGDYSGGHDVLGKAAAGGNVSMQYFAVGSGLQPGSDRSNTLVAGGNLNITHGSVHGDAHYGGTTTANETVSFLGGALSKGEPIDFIARGDELMEISERLASEEANGTTHREPWGGIFLSGTDPELNIFEVSASAFNGAAYFSINVPSGAFALVNISGGSASFSNFGHGYTGVDATGVLFNFPEATNINASSFGFFGTVLAPYAHVTFNNGSWDGGIYAASFTGNAEGHIAPLREFVTCEGGGQRL